MQPTKKLNPFEEDLKYLGDKLNNAQIPDELRSNTLRMLSRVEKSFLVNGYSQEFETISKYIDWIAEIPWGKFNYDNLDIQNVVQTLEKNHFGIQKVKREILEYIAVMKLKSMKLGSQQLTEVPVMCFVGLQGIGKTTMAHSIAQALGRPMIRISMGGMSSITEIRGTPKSLSDAEPGQIIKALIKSQTMNPIIVLDEIDKVSGQEGKSKDFYAALLEILDPEQNNSFKDHYLDFSIDLSKVMFICTANNLGPISAALLDRLEIVRFVSYTDEEKTVIAKSYLLPKVLGKTGLTPQQASFSEDVWPLIIRPLGYDSGIRQLERSLLGICRRIARTIIDQDATSVYIDLSNIQEYLPEPTIF